MFLITGNMRIYQNVEKTLVPDVLLEDTNDSYYHFGVDEASA